MDILDLKAFYKQNLGGWVRRLMGAKLRSLCLPTEQENMLIVGYGVPYAPLFQEYAGRLALLMPARQGVVRWPQEFPCLTVLAAEESWPFPNNVFHRVLFLHSLEFCQKADHFLKESWRVLAPQGEVTVVVPNRLSVWSRLDRTPFGHGHPYTFLQLSTLFRKNLFVPGRRSGALFFPPSHSRFILSGAKPWENIGKKWFSHLSGVLIMQARKQVYAPFSSSPVRWSEAVFQPA